MTTGSTLRYSANGLMGFVAFICLTVVLGWIGNIHIWESLGKSFTPIHLNLAFVLMIGAVGVIFYQSGKNIIGFGIGLVMTLCGLILFVEYASHSNLGYMEMFLDNPYSRQPIRAIDIAPITRLEIFFIGLSILILMKGRGWRMLLVGASLASCGVIVLASMGILAHVLNEPVLSGAETLGAMTLMEPVVFLLLSIGILMQVRYELIQVKASRRVGVPIAFGAFTLFLTLIIWLGSIQEEVTRLHEQLMEKASQQSLFVLDQLAVMNKLLRRTALQYPLEGGPKKQMWEINAAGVAKDLGNLKQMEIVNEQDQQLWKLSVDKPANANVSTDSKIYLEMRKRLIAEVIQSKNIKYGPLSAPRIGQRDLMMAAPVMQGDAVKGVLIARVPLEKIFSQLTPDIGFHLIVRQRGEPIYTMGSEEDLLDNSWLASARVLSQKVAWTVQLLPSADSLREMQGMVAPFCLGGGILLSVIFTILLHFRVLAAENGAEAQKEKNSFRAAGNLVSQCLFKANTQGEFLAVNKIWTNFTGMSEEEAIGSGWKKRIHPEDLSKFENDWAVGVKSAPGSNFNLSFRILSQDGSESQIQGIVTSIPGTRRISSRFVGTLLRS